VTVCNCNAFFHSPPTHILSNDAFEIESFLVVRSYRQKALEAALLIDGHSALLRAQSQSLATGLSYISNSLVTTKYNYMPQCKVRRSFEVEVRSWNLCSPAMVSARCVDLRSRYGLYNSSSIQGSSSGLWSFPE